MSAVRELWRILCLHTRIRFGVSTWGRKGGNLKKTIGYGLLLLYGIAALSGVYGFVLYPIMVSAAELKLESLVMAFVVLVSLMATLVFGIMNLIGIVFTAKDAEFYAALPVRPQSVFGAKFGMVYLTELGITAFILFPAGIIRQMVGTAVPLPDGGMQTEAGFSLLFCLRLLLVWLLVPAIPLALGALVSMPFIRLAGTSRHRDAVTVILSLVLIIGLMVGQMLISSRMSGIYDSPEQIQLLLENPDGLIQMVTGAFPPAQWAAAFLTGAGAEAGLGLLYYVLTAAAGLFICLLLSRRLYYKAVLSGLEAPRGKTKGYNAGKIRAGSVVGSFFKKELRVLLRTPVYAMNALAGSIFIPVSIVVMKFTSGGGIGADGEPVGGLYDGFDDMSFFLFALSVFLFIGVLNIGVTTTFSRDGKQLWLYRALPVMTRTHVLSRFLCGVLLAVFGCIISFAAMVFAAGFPVWPVLSGLAMSLFGTLPVTAAAMIPDALHPKLRWNSEAEAIKQNLNSIWGMLIGMGVLIVLAIPAAVLAVLRVPVWGICLGMGILVVGATIGLLIAVSQIAEGMLSRIEG